MKQCPFCGTQWEGNGPCPGCGVGSETPRDDSLFRPPEEGKKTSQESSPNFEVEELLRWKPSPETSSTEAEEPPIEEEAEPADSADLEERKTSLKRPLKRWQKLAMVAVAIVVVAAIVVRLWPKDVLLPQVPAFFVQDDTLMVLPVNGEPQEITPYNQTVGETLQASPDQKSAAWEESGPVLKVFPASGEKVKTWEEGNANSPRFSQDGKYLYFSMKEEGTDSAALWQYDIASGEERMVGPLYWNYFVEDSTLLAAYDGTSLTVYDPGTVEEKWSLEADVRWMEVSDGRLYFAQTGEETSQLCCWQDGQTEVLLENIECLYTREDSTVYIQCYQEEVVPVTELIKDDLGNADGQKLMQELENMKIHSPGRVLYCFDGKELHQMGEDQRLYFFSYLNHNAAICSVEYPSVEEVKGTFSLSELYDVWVQQGAIAQIQVESMWPYESSLDYVAKGETLFHLPKDVPQDPDSMQIQGDWVCFYVDGEEEGTLWLGKIEGESVVSKTVFTFQETMNYTVTSEGNLYYWRAGSIGPIFENGLPVASQAHLQTLQCTDDGAIYFLEGTTAAEFTLNRIYQGKVEEVAENVKDFTAYTRDYVVYLQYQDEEKQDLNLFAYTTGKSPALVSEGVKSLLPVIQQNTPQFDVNLMISYRGPVGYIDMNPQLATWAEKMEEDRPLMETYD